MTWHKIPDKAYHENYRLSSHKLIDFIHSPEDYEYFHLQGNKRKMNEKALEFGTLFHMAILEPERFEKKVKINPEVDRRTTVGKNLHASFMETLFPGDIAISQSDFETLSAMRDRLFESSVARELLRGEGMNEMVGFFDWNGVDCRCKPDRITPQFIVDLKTAEDSSLQAFSRAAEFKWSYLLQAAFYAKGAASVDGIVREFKFVVIEKTPPYKVGVYHVPSVVLGKAIVDCQNAIERLKTCIQTKHFPRNGDIEQDLIVSNGFFERGL